MPLFWLSLTFLCGILLASKVSFPILAWCVLGGVGLLLAIPPIQRRVSAALYTKPRGISSALQIPSVVLYPLMMVTMCLGAIRYLSSLPKIEPSFIAYYNDQATQSVIEGVIDDPPDVRDGYTNLRVEVNTILPAGETQSLPVRGTLLARVATTTVFNYGDRVRLQGKLQTPPENEDFSYRDYLANRGIYSYLPYPTTSLLQVGQGSPLKAWLYTFRQNSQKVIYSFFPDPEASLLAGILLGIQTGISTDVQEAFRLTGTSHIIVISGFNITIIAGLFTLLFSRLLGRYKGALAAAIGIILYTLVVGANAAVVRAAILGLLTLIGHLVGRRQSGLNSLTFAGGVMALITPSVVWDVSFQLSFAATLGIMLYAEPMTDWFIKTAARFISQEKAEKLAGPVSEYFLLTLAAQLTTLPLMIYYFKRLSLTALIANPLILPAQPALMVLGGLAVLVGLVVHPLGQLFAWAAWPFAAYTIRVVEWLAKIPHGSLALGQVAVPLIILFYVALISLTLFRSRLAMISTRLTPAIPLTCMLAASFLVWKAAFYAPDGLMHVTILDVGTGEAVLIQSASGRNVLINGGASTLVLSNALGRRAPPFQRSLDWLVVADIDEEDLAGIAGNLERFTPGNVLWAGNASGTRAAGELWAEIGAAGIPTSLMQAGQALELGPGAKLTAIAVNERGAVLVLEWENFRMLLPMGIDLETLTTLAHNSAMRNFSVVLLAESGYMPVNPPELLAQLNPQVTVLSVAAADRTGLPSAETIQALEGYNLLRTDQNGWIQISTDGQQMWVETERK